MDKTTKRGLFIALSIVAIIVAVLAWPVYFGTQLSATSSHLKDYNYSTTAKQFEKEIIQIISADSRATYTITDSTGTKDNRSYYMTIEQNLDNVLYSYNITYSDNGNSSCDLGLVGVFDKTNQSGGYKNTDKDVDKLIDIFERRFTDKISVMRR